MMCECSGAGFCNVWSLRMTHRMWELCVGINCTEEQHKKYIEFFRSGAKPTQEVKREPPQPSKPLQPPGLVSKARSFGKSMLTYFRNKRRVVDDSVQSERFEKCKGCEYLVGDDKPQCRACGCYLVSTPVGLPGKTYMPHESCPIGLWGVSTVHSSGNYNRPCNC